MGQVYSVESRSYQTPLAREASNRLFSFALFRCSGTFSPPFSGFHFSILISRQDHREEVLSRARQFSPRLSLYLSPSLSLFLSVSLCPVNGIDSKKVPREIHRGCPPLARNFPRRVRIGKNCSIDRT